MLKAAEGGYQTVKAECPRCLHAFSVEAWKRPDPNAGIKLIEMLHGRAAETKDINIRAKHLYELLDNRDEVGGTRIIDVYDMTPEEEEEKRLLLAEIVD